MHKYQVWLDLHKSTSTIIIEAEDEIEAIKKYAEIYKRKSLEMIFAERIEENAE